MSERTKPPYRADHVGSLLRPAALKEARAKRALGAISAEALKAIEDREIEDVIRRQEEVGLKSITDGEFRRVSWNYNFLERHAGVESYEGERKIKFNVQGPQPRSILLRVIGKLGGYKPHPMIDDFQFLMNHTRQTAKMTIPSPSSLHFRYGRDAVPETIYPVMDEFYADLGQSYCKAVRAFADVGCRYLQLDEVNLAYLCDPALREHIRARGEDPAALPDIYASMINAAIADIPDDMTITMHDVSARAALYQSFQEHSIRMMLVERRHVPMIVYDKLMALEIEPVVQVYEAKDCMLYALGVGLGHDPMNEDELAFVYEKNLKVLPTMATVVGHSTALARNPNTGIDWLMVVNGEQGFTLRRPLKGHDAVIGRTRIVEVIDKGPGKGALLLIERAITDKATGDPIGTVTQTIFCRGDGGFGGPPREAPPPRPIPARAPDVVCDLGTRPEMALIYRLSGDYNPLHAEPAFAKAAGFPLPILHGLGTFGVSGHALLKTMCGYDPARLASFACRFSAPVFPGETIRTEMWRDGDIVSFRARVVERDVIAINNGRAEVRS